MFPLLLPVALAEFPVAMLLLPSPLALAARPAATLAEMVPLALVLLPMAVPRNQQQDPGAGSWQRACERRQSEHYRFLW